MSILWQERKRNIFGLPWSFTVYSLDEEKLLETQSYTHIGNWWNRKGEDEIDIIAADDLSKTATFYEVKRQRSEISMPILAEKARHFIEATGKFKDYEVKYEGLCIEDM